jgi:2-succinyl-5-enolpyruvyl-6-hydroxy-3-cyclohexene-1-carboxylate synthase
MSFSLKDLRKIYFCTGARNQALLSFFTEQEIDFEIDERIASFKSLGFNKLENHSSAVCTTSGTAVTECLSAMTEAFYSNTPFILISGDRPKKLHGTGSPQTISHEELTRGARRQYLELELKDLAALSISEIQFPLHINILVDDTVAHNKIWSQFSSLEEAITEINTFKNPLILLSHEQVSLRPLALKLKSLNVPFYAETLSGARDLSYPLTERDLLKQYNNDEFDSLIRIGHTPLSKVWRLLERKPLPVLSFDSRGLPGLSYGKVLKISAAQLAHDPQFLSVLSAFSKTRSYHDEKLSELLLKYPQSEISFFHHLVQKLDTDAAVYLGNSLVIRFFELVQSKCFQVFGNRGVNGIDGQLSTAIGLAHALKNPLTCILGDYTTFYDLSALRDLPLNFQLIIMNNKGGRIFDMLSLDKRIVMEHTKDFQSIASGLNLTYSNHISDFGKAQVLELTPNQNDTEAFLREWKV